MASDAPSAEELERRIADLEAVVASQAELIRSQAELIESQRETIEKLEAKVAGLERQLGQNSGNSGTPPSRDTAAERQRQAEERQRRPQAKGAGAKRRKGMQRGAPDKGLRMSAAPDEVVDHRPARCGGCGAELGDDLPQRVCCPAGRRPARGQARGERAPGPTPANAAADTSPGRSSPRG